MAKDERSVEYQLQVKRKDGSLGGWGDCNMKPMNDLDEANEVLKNAKEDPVNSEHEYRLKMITIDYYY